MERREAMPLAAVLVAPSVILWTFAGLETPLLAAIVMAMAAVYAQMDAGNARRLPVLAALAGLAVLTRYDAVLFAGPVLLAALAQTSQSWKKRLIAVALAGVPPSIWFMYAWLHYGSVLPTSFYIKTPTAELDVVAVNRAVHGRASADWRHGRHGGICHRARGDAGRRVAATLGRRTARALGTPCRPRVGARLWRQHGDRAHDVRVPSFRAVFWRDGAGIGASRPAGRRSA